MVVLHESVATWVIRDRDGLGRAEEDLERLVAPPGSRDDGIGFAVLHEVRRDEDARVLLLAQGQRRMLVHADDLAGVDDPDVVRERSRRCFATTAWSPTRMTWSAGWRTGEVEGARDDLGGTVVAAHRVDGDAHAGRGGRLGRTEPRLGHEVSGRRCRRYPGGLELDRLAALVPAAVRAGVMGLLGLVAVRTLLDPSGGRSPRCERRSPWRACETRRLGTPMRSGAPCVVQDRGAAGGRPESRARGRTDGGVYRETGLNVRWRLPGKHRARAMVTTAPEVNGNGPRTVTLSARVT